MTESEWLQATGPRQMLEFLRTSGKADDRKLRLFACACCRCLWPLLIDPRSRAAVEAAERSADGHCDPRTLARAHRIAVYAITAAVDRPFKTITSLLGIVKQALRRGQSPSLGGMDALLWDACCCAQCASQPHALDAARQVSSIVERISEALAAAPAGIPALPSLAVPDFQARLLRELLGNPMRPPVVPSSWLLWSDGIVKRLAEAIYRERAFDRLPILADALEEAGCTNQEVLSHCRSGGDHALGCWVIDTLCGLEFSADA